VYRFRSKPNRCFTAGAGPDDARYACPSPAHHAHRDGIRKPPDEPDQNAQRNDAGRQPGPRRARDEDGGHGRDQRKEHDLADGDQRIAVGRVHRPHERVDLGGGAKLVDHAHERRQVEQLRRRHRDNSGDQQWHEAIIRRAAHPRVICRLCLDCIVATRLVLGA
jgi:hypothetical protein